MQSCDAWAAVADRLAESYPSALHERADELPQPGVVPVAYSMGGRIVLHRALAEPDRWPALVLVGVSAGVDDPEARRKADEELAEWIKSSTIEDVVAHWEAQPVFATQSSEVVAAQREGRLSHDPGELAHLLRSYGQGVMPSVWDRLAELNERIEIDVAVQNKSVDPIVEKHLVVGVGVRRCLQLLRFGS